MFCFLREQTLFFFYQPTKWGQKLSNSWESIHPEETGSCCTFPEFYHVCAKSPVSGGSTLGSTGRNIQYRNTKRSLLALIAWPKWNKLESEKLPVDWNFSKAFCFHRGGFCHNRGCRQTLYLSGLLCPCVLIDFTVNRLSLVLPCSCVCILMSTSLVCMNMSWCVCVGVCVCMFWTLYCIVCVSLTHLNDALV